MVDYGDFQASSRPLRERSPRARPRSDQTMPSRNTQPWPEGLVATLGQFLPESIFEVILQRAAESEGLGPASWYSAAGRARLIRHLCRRAEIYLKPPDRSRFREALDEAGARAGEPPADELTRPGTTGAGLGTSGTGAEMADSRPARLPPGAHRDPGRASGLTRQRAEERLQHHRAVDRALADRTASPAGRPPGGAPALVLAIPILREIDILTARTETLSLAQRAGASVLMRTRAATVVSELARNIFRYAGEGTIRLVVTNGQLEILAEDKGPGIPDVEQVLGGGYESKTGMGMGLVGSKKIADQFEVRSALGEGTCVRALIALG